MNAAPPTRLITSRERELLLVMWRWYAYVGTVGLALGVAFLVPYLVIHSPISLASQLPVLAFLGVLTLALTGVVFGRAHQVRATGAAAAAKGTAFIVSGTGVRTEHGGRGVSSYQIGDREFFVPAGTPVPSDGRMKFEIITGDDWNAARGNGWASSFNGQRYEPLMWLPWRLVPPHEGHVPLPRP